MTSGVHLRRSEKRTVEVEALAAALTRTGGGRVGLEGVLDDLNRSATVVRVPAFAAGWGFRWDDEDTHSRRWWPQGITTSADHDPAEAFRGRAVVITSAYSRDLAGVHKGSRITVVDLTDRTRPRYRHVLLVDPYLREDGPVDVRRLKVHAGGLVWHGDHLHVAGTARGISTFRLSDIVRVASPGDPDRLGVGQDSVGQDSFGYRYLLPVWLSYDAFADEGHDPMRYSFLSLDRTGPEPRLLAGEYGRRGASTRLVDFGTDPATGLLRVSEEGHTRPLSVSAGALEGMQGATVVDGRWYVTTSAGRYLKGSLYVGRPGAFRRRARVLPVGVEDLSYWRTTDELWSLSEYPGLRYVFAMDRARLG
jgi:hypothetical protein